MIGKFIVPVLNTETGNFDYKGHLGRQEYEEMVADTFAKNNARIQSLVNSIDNGTEYDFGNRRIITKDTHMDITLSECEALFLTSKKKEYEAKNLQNYVESGKMSIIIVNINPNTLEPDAEGDLKYWIADSKKVLSDKKTTDKVKLEMLPKMSFMIKSEQETYRLNNCKMFEDYADEKFPFYFALIIEKITK